MPKGWDEQPVHLQEFEAIVGRFKADIDRGAIPAQPTAHELAAWCNVMHAAIPAELVRALAATTTGATAQPANPQFPQTIRVPAWVPAGVIASNRHTDAKPAKPKRGRPKVAPGTYESIVTEAAREQMDQARHGKLRTIRDLASHIEAMGMGSGMTRSTIEARLKGKLPTEKAKQTAMRANQRST